MSRMKYWGAGVAVMTGLVLVGCGTNTQLPEIREASFNRAAIPAATHDVRQGETIYSIAWQHNIDYRDLARFNNLTPPYPIRAGQKLQLSETAGAAPAATGHAQTKPLAGSDGGDAGATNADEGWLMNTPQASRNETPSQAQKPLAAGGTSQGAAVPQKGFEQASSASSASPAAKSDTASTSSAMWQWPLKGAIVGHFTDPSSITAGIDIAGHKGDSIVAARAGTVVYSGNNVRGYGNLVIIKHDDHFLSAYAHADALRVKEKDAIKAGQVIATVGDTETDRTKLHFEIRQDGQSKDPLQFLPRS